MTDRLILTILQSSDRKWLVECRATNAKQGRRDAVIAADMRLRALAREDALRLNVAVSSFSVVIGSTAGDHEYLDTVTNVIRKLSAEYISFLRVDRFFTGDLTAINPLQLVVYVHQGTTNPPSEKPGFARDRGALTIAGLIRAMHVRADAQMKIPQLLVYSENNNSDIEHLAREQLPNCQIHKFSSKEDLLHVSERHIRDIFEQAIVADSTIMEDGAHGDTVQFLRRNELAEGLANLPNLPDKQIAGPHFYAADSGIIDVQPRNTPLPESHRDRVRLITLHAELIRAARDLADGLRSHANEFPRAFDLATRYLDSVQGDLDKIDFAAIYGIGLRLAYLAEATKREIADRLVPSIEDAECEALESLLMLHGPFVLSSDEGRQLVEAAERFQLQRDEVPVVLAAARRFSSGVNERPDIASPAAAESIAETIEYISGHSFPERHAVYTLSGIVNFSIVAGELAVAASLGDALGTEGIAAVAGSWALLRSQPQGREALRTAQHMFGGLHRTVVEGLSSGLLGFFRDQEDTLRVLSNYSIHLRFLDGLLRWLKKQQGWPK
jgi:hypothetical protein